MGNVNIDRLNRTLGEFLYRAQNAEPAYREIGVLMSQDMKTNIAEGGRPTKWLPSKRAKKKGGQTLRDSGTLMNGITSEATNTGVAAGPTAVGRKHLTDPRIMALLAFGGQVKRFGRSELFIRHRVTKGKNKGRFSKGTHTASGIEGRKRGFTLGESIANYPARDYTFIPPERGETFSEIMQRFVLGS